MLDAHPFDDLYNSSNIGDLAGREYDLVVSAGNRADSHRINTHGAEDLAEIDQLVDTISSARIGKLVLISTVCVYPWGGAPDESTPLSADGLTPYGANRLHQEQRLTGAFDTLIVRLPQLYGARLRKGVVYDLANDYRVEFIDPAMAFQHYDVRRLWGDIETALTAGLPAFNVATPPITNAELAREVFDREISGQTPPSAPSPFARMYTRNMTTAHTDVFGGGGGYLHSTQDEFDGLRRFVDEIRSDQDGQA
nr:MULTISPECIES: NAD-dependent epimerase/dehydratase family protein [Microbacterium]